MRTTPTPSTAPGATGSFRRRWTIRPRSTGSVTITRPSSRIAAQLCPSHVSVPAFASVAAMRSWILVPQTGGGKVRRGGNGSRPLDARGQEAVDLEHEPDTADELRDVRPGPAQEQGPFEDARPAGRTFGGAHAHRGARRATR